MKETFVLLFILFLISPLIILVRFVADITIKISKRLGEWMKSFVPKWLKGE